MSVRASGTDRDYAQGKEDGEIWARQTGETAADLGMVPNVPGTTMYKAGFRVGVAGVRNERANAEACGCWDSQKLGHCIHTV